jgi:hypothetical protein
MLIILVIIIDYLIMVLIIINDHRVYVDYIGYIRLHNHGIDYQHTTHQLFIDYMLIVLIILTDYYLNNNISLLYLTQKGPQ